MKTKNKFSILLVLVLFFSACSKHEQPGKIKLNKKWKFITGDKPEYAGKNFDDKKWEELSVNKTWNKQGYPKYYGFAWYRTKFYLPSSLKENAELRDSLILKLGKIDDFDQVFLNGVLIGENLRNVKRGTKATNDFKNLEYSFWDKQRRYSLPVNDTLLKWDAENVLAIRVYDWGVAGGIYSGELEITMPQIQDYLKFEINKGDFSENENKFVKSFSIRNASAAYKIKGEIEVDLRNNLSDEDNDLLEKEIVLSPQTSENFVVKFDKPDCSETLEYEFEFENKAEIELTEGVPYVLTPQEKETPQINGALVYGQNANKPFLYKIAATGKSPLTYRAENLPEGLELDKRSGIISGRVAKAGKYAVNLIVENAFGKDEKTLEIVIGEKLALTPPMGWNSWNCWGLSVSQKKIADAAKAFVEKGLINHGWTYINIDDGWEIKGGSKKPKRTKDGRILTNEKFPDMKKLGKQIHAYGLKFGIYSSPGPLTCGGFTASYGHEFQDAQTFADWGIDYLKYDLCSYRKLMKDKKSQDELIPPYKKMHEALMKTNRDIVYSICEYGYGEVWKWGEKVGGNLWRTTSDIWDDWKRMFEIGFGQAGLEKYAGPGHWNDPDMLVVGWVGWGPNLHRTNLTPDEQYTHVSLWALLSAPLLLGNDLTKLDDFTMNLITNDEVIAIDQDKLGKQASRIFQKDSVQVWKKELHDGNLAVGIFNVSLKNKKFSLDFKKIGIKGKVSVRDVWRQKDIGKFKNKFETPLPAHGVRLIKIFKGNKK